MPNGLNSGLILGAHLDLKGVQPREEYLRTYLRDLRSQGCNTLLVEYEDVFPFQVPSDLALDQASVWSRRRLEGFLREASRCGIEIIPLQQCLGHLEYVFRWERHRRFAENRTDPATLKLASRPGKELIQGMLRQVLDAHPESRYVHLGLDEARHLHESSLVKTHGGVLPLYLSYLDELCSVVEENGKTPIIWSDMLEDHYAPDSALKKFRDRVVLMVWDYSSCGRTMLQGRIHGHRLSRAWLGRADAPDAPPIDATVRLLEDLPPAVHREVSPYCRNGYWNVLWQVDFYTKLGFRVLGATATRKSEDGPVLPDYMKMFGNLDAWVDAVARNRQLGLVATSWERGTTFRQPNYNIDLQWPGLARMSLRLGAKPRAFWTGAGRKALDRILLLSSRCRQGWSLQTSLKNEMDAFERKLRGMHRYEWRSLRLMQEVSELHKRIDACRFGVDPAALRLPAAAWTRRLRDQARAGRDLVSLRRRLQKHFRKRYTGAALEEWFRLLFDRHEKWLKSWCAECLQNRCAARDLYAATSRSKDRQVKDKGMRRR